MTEQAWQGVKWAEMVLNQEKNLTMDKKIVIVVCPTGALFSRRQNPNQPYTPEEIANDVIAAYEEGAAVAHLHNRDARGAHTTGTALLKETVDRILDKCPDMIIQPSSCSGYVPGASQYSYETVKPMVDELLSIDRRYMESTIFTPVSYALEDMHGHVDVTLATEKNSVETVRFLQDNHVKPEFMNHNWEGIQNVIEWLIKPGILEKPYLMSMGPGMHNTAPTYPDPWGIMYVLGMMKMMPADSVISLSGGGRNWLALTVCALVLGIDAVRVGMEDQLWMYPHKDEKMKSSADATRKVATISRELGRDVASPADARKVLGISEA